MTTLHPREHKRGEGLIVDLFAGAGGASTGIEAALGRPVSLAINHAPTAIAVHARNHPQTIHMMGDVREVDPLEATGARPIDVLWASPDCTHFSNAKGNTPRSSSIRSLAWVVVDWAAKTRPKTLYVENVREFMGWGPLGPDGRPDKAQAGTTFQEWVGALRALGYSVDARVLDAADYGAGTHRRRLFVVGRRDGVAPVWPAPTHGPGRAHPHVPAATAIDWDLPTRSIFGRERPLAEATMRRIAAGIKRYVLDSPAPFLVGAAIPGSTSARSDGPGRTSTSMAAAALLVQTGYGERPGQAPRTLDIEDSLGTIVACGAKHALVTAFLAKHYGGVVGTPMGSPIGTITAIDHHSVVAAHLIKLRGTSTAASVRNPAPTVTAGGTHLGLVAAFLTSYYGAEAAGASVASPLRTVTTRDHHGLVAVTLNLGDGDKLYAIADIGLRMLTPAELLRAQFGGYAEAYDLGAAPTKTAQIRLIGNSVCPHAAAALVRANSREAALGDEAL